MNDSQAGDPRNETSAPQPQARDKKPSRPDIAIYTAALGVFGAIVGALLTWAFDLGLVWQVAAVFLGALLMGGFCATYLMLAFGVAGGPKRESLAKRPLWAGFSFILFFPILAAVVGAFLGGVGPGGGLMLSLQFAGFAAAVALATVLIGFPLGLLLAKATKAAPRPVQGVVMGALLGCPLGSALWRAWFEVGWFNLGIPVVGIPMAFAFFLMVRQVSKGTESS